MIFAAACAAPATVTKGTVSATATAPRPAACDPQRPEPCEAACFAGDGHACAVYGLAVEGVADAPVRLKADRERGLRALLFGCARGESGRLLDGGVIPVRPRPGLQGRRL